MSREDEIDGAGKTAIVVDDDDAVRHSTSALLKQLGYSVRSYESGDALLNAGVERGAVVILLDVLMPGRSGLETLQALKAQGSMPPVIMVSGHADVMLAVEAMHHGAADFLEKPYSLSALLQALSAVKATE